MNARVTPPAPGTIDETALAEMLRRDPAPSDVVDGIGFQRVGACAVLTLARPERHNVVNLDGWRRIVELMADLTADRSVRALVVRGAGLKAFGTGCDISEFPAARMGPAAAVYNETLARALRAIDSLPIPVVGMLRGLTVGAGLQIASACDVRFASPDVRAGIPIGQLGVVIGLTEAEMLVRSIGAAELKHLIFSGRLVDAAEVVRMGLVQRIVESEELPAATAELSAVICSNAPITMRSGKLVVGMVGRSLGAADTEVISRAMAEAFDGGDLREGVDAFMERRRPVFPSHVGDGKVMS